MRTNFLILALLLISLAARDGHADAAAEAAVHAEAGKKAFAAQRFAEAISEFQAANALVPDSKLLYAIAQAQRMAGDCASAVDSYQQFLATRPDAKLAKYSQANIARCKEELAANPAPEPAPIVAPPPEPTPEPAPAPVPFTTALPERVDGSRPWYRDWVGNAMVIGGTGGVAVGVVLYLQGRSAAQRANDATDYASFIEARDAADSALTRQRIGIGAAVVGVGLIVGGILHYRLGSSEHEVHVTAAPIAGGAAVFAGMEL